ncbi:MAG: hypothetical protein U9Q83_01410, partial [Bacteroidota bacterium]|nr:hypothetical protein [Bacteroidota bacterium]
MKAIIKFFLKNTGRESEIVYAKAKLMLILSMANVLLLGTMVLIFVAQGLFDRIGNNLISIGLYLFLIILIYLGKSKIAGNLFAITMSLIISMTILTVNNNALVFDYFMNGYYLFLFAIVFSGMFASRIVFISTFAVMFVSSVVTYIITKAKFPDEIVSSASNGIITYLFVMVMIFVLTFFFSKYIEDIIKDLYDKSKKVS